MLMDKWSSSLVNGATPRRRRRRKEANRDLAMIEATAGGVIAGESNGLQTATGKFHGLGVWKDVFAPSIIYISTSRFYRVNFNFRSNHSSQGSL